MVTWLSRRVPYKSQTTIGDCGAACLAMILGFYGRDVSVSDVRSVVGGGRDGVSAEHLAAAGRGYDLDVKASVLSEPGALRHLPMPAIVHWNHQHFLVIEAVRTKGVLAIDPGQGRRSLTWAEVAAGFAGVALTFAPTASFALQKSAHRPPWRSPQVRALLRDRQVRILVAQLLGMSALLQAVGLAVPLFTSYIIDTVLAIHLTDALSIVGVGAIFAMVAQSVARYTRSRVVVSLQVVVDSRLVAGVLRHLLALSLEFFQRRTTGDLMIRLGSSATVRDLVTTQLVNGVLDLGMLLVYGAILALFAPILAVAAVTIGVAQLLVLAASVRPMHELSQRHLASHAECQGYLVELISGIGLIKASGCDQQVYDHWLGLFRRQLDVGLERNQSVALIDAALTGLRTMAPLLLLIAGAHQVMSDGMPLGMMLAMNALALSVLGPLGSLVSLAQQLQGLRAQWERLEDILETTPEQCHERPGCPVRLEHSIAFRDVWFSYDRHSTPVLRGVDFAVRRGQRVLIVGKTGSGKSTLLRLLLGLYRPTHGEVAIDGVPLDEIDLQQLRQQTGVVLQETFFLNGTVRQNIALTDPGCPQTRIEEAARLAEVVADIAAMPMRYETVIAEGARALSAGQRQRLSLARALLRQPKLLVLDEATSHLDPETEGRVFDNLSQVRCTSFIVAHRPRALADADLILVMDRGRIVEQGTHAELTMRGGLYANLFGIGRVEDASALPVSDLIAHQVPTI